MDKKAVLEFDGKKYELPVIIGTENEPSIDISKLRAQSGAITFDDGYGNTGSCQSNITFIDGEKGILKHRGYSIEELAENSKFLETAYLVIYGELPNKQQADEFSSKCANNAAIHEGMRQVIGGFPSNSHPMAILSASMNTLGCFNPNLATNDRATDLEAFDETATALISKVRTIAALTYRIKQGLPIIYPRSDLKYTANFLHMMFSAPNEDADIHQDVVDALDSILLLHADHEQNCSTSTVRMVGSSGASLFASVASGICALWGPLHGGANMAVINMLNSIHASGDDGSTFIENAKKGESRLMGFGHRVYKSYDPRAKILKTASEKVLKALNVSSPILDIARKLEEAALSDEYFIQRNLYPNVDFYSGTILQAIGIPLEMFTVMFAMGRMPGWIANWKEIAEGKTKIHRPRQIYMGEVNRTYTPIDKR